MATKRRGLLADIIQFTREAKTHWTAGIMGGFVSAALMVSGAYITAVNTNSNPNPGLYVAWALLIWAGLFVIISCFLAWQKKADELQNARLDVDSSNRRVADRDREIEDKTSQLISTRNQLDQERLKHTPNLVAQLGQPLLYGPDNAEYGVSVTFTMNIKNVPPSSDSAAVAYRIRVSKQDLEAAYTFEKINSDIPIGGELLDATWTDIISVGDSLIDKTTEPIPSGGVKGGWLVAFLKHFKTRQDLNGAKITVEFQDITGKVVAIEWTADTEHLGQMTSLPTIAGIKGAYKQTPKPKPPDALPP